MDQLHHGRLNRVFELDGVKYMAWPKPAARGSKKCKAGARSEVDAVPRKSWGAKRRRGASSQTGDRTSERELLLEMSLKLSKKSVAVRTKARSLGLSASEKALVAKVSTGPPPAAKSGTKRAPPASDEKDDSGYTSAHMVTLVDTSSASEEELTPNKPIGGMHLHHPHLLWVWCPQERLVPW
jgi:hypothetical protein